MLPRMLLPAEPQRAWDVRRAPGVKERRVRRGTVPAQ